MATEVNIEHYHRTLHAFDVSISVCLSLNCYCHQNIPDCMDNTCFLLFYIQPIGVFHSFLNHCIINWQAGQKGHQKDLNPFFGTKSGMKKVVLL